MRDTVEQLIHEARESLELLRTLRDEIRVELHLAEMEVQTRWHEEYEPYFSGAEKAVEEMEVSARNTIEDAIERYRLFRDIILMEQPRNCADANHVLGERAGGSREK